MSSRSRRPAVSPSSPALLTAPAGVRSIRSRSNRGCCRIFMSSATPRLLARCRNRPWRPTRRRKCAPAPSRAAAWGSPPTPKLINSCYSLVAPDYGISMPVSINRRTDNSRRSRVGAVLARLMRRLTIAHQGSARADGWFNTITAKRSAERAGCALVASLLLVGAVAPAPKNCAPTRSSATRSLPR